ncbi:TPA: hypothetical protein DIV55_04835 [Patescibacteria group bacterium]|uniref:Alpha/beta hydrolase fold protein n=1 Tax=Candidatus Gottesmanbacteria bacterium GW2011_GWA1_43_11 TaxID=1618436 RepID=A0A0G1CDS9_9BACT|nr:MAG: Alpha/beta hydrolase fold protein [Candidatus Gottesmanbacteria bacterium GW2011_GWA1_43_11]HCS79035.1 hypothetical protein [Patescibacteria group bacterium]
MPTYFSTRTYEVNGIKLNVAEAGTGETLVFIHGWSNNWQGWTLLAEQLAPHYKLYLLDLPGFGDSDRLEAYSIDLEADIIANFVTKFAPHPRALIGASLGTIITAQTLERYPHLTNRIILLGTIFKQLSLKEAATAYEKILKFADKTEIATKILSGTVKSPLTAYLVEKFLNAYKFNKELVDKYSLPGRSKISGKSYVQLGLSAADFVMEKFLKQATQKILLIYGEADKYVRPEDAQAILETIKSSNITLTIIPKAGHNPAYEQPEKTAAIIRTFLN